MEEEVWSALVRVVSPFTAREEEAEIAPVTVRFWEKVEEADATSPPEELM